jgi:hypothetical protein
LVTDLSIVFSSTAPDMLWAGLRIRILSDPDLFTRSGSYSGLISSVALFKIGTYLSIILENFSLNKIKLFGNGKFSVVFGDINMPLYFPVVGSRPGFGTGSGTS